MPGDKDHRLLGNDRVAAAPTERAIHRLTSHMQRELLLNRGMVHGLVERNTDDITGSNVLEIGGRPNQLDSRPKGGELPRKVLCQNTTGRIGQSGRDARLVRCGRHKALVRVEEIDGSIEPLAFAANRRHKGQGIGQLFLLIDGHQGYHRPIKDDGYHRIGIQFIAVRRWHHL